MSALATLGGFKKSGVPVRSCWFLWERQGLGLCLGGLGFRGLRVWGLGLRVADMKEGIGAAGELLDLYGKAPGAPFTNQFITVLSDPNRDQKVCQTFLATQTGK